MHPVLKFFKSLFWKRNRRRWVGPCYNLTLLCSITVLKSICFSSDIFSFLVASESCFPHLSTNISPSSNKTPSKVPFDHDLPTALSPFVPHYSQPQDCQETCSGKFRLHSECILRPVFWKESSIQSQDAKYSIKSWRKEEISETRGAKIAPWFLKFRIPSSWALRVQSYFRRSALQVNRIKIATHQYAEE